MGGGGGKREGRPKTFWQGQNFCAELLRQIDRSVQAAGNGFDIDPIRASNKYHRDLRCII